MGILREHVNAESSAIKQCARRPQCNGDVEDRVDAALQMNMSNRSGVSRADRPDICFWSTSFLKRGKNIETANYSVLGSIPLDDTYSVVWFDPTLVHTEYNAKEFKELIEQYGDGFQVSLIGGGNRLKCAVFPVRPPPPRFAVIDTYFNDASLGVKLERVSDVTSTQCAERCTCAKDYKVPEEEEAPVPPHRLETRQDQNARHCRNGGGNGRGRV